MVRTAAKKRIYNYHTLLKQPDKIVRFETAMEMTSKAIQFHGGCGYIRDYPVEKMRDTKFTEIYEGTSEVQRMVISAQLLK